MIDLSQIQEHAEVIGADGVHVGTVDHVQGDRIKLTKRDSPDEKHHFIPVGLIAEVEAGEARPDQTELEAVRWFTRDEAGALLRGELDGAFAPPPFAIAHSLIAAWAKR